MGLFYAAMCAFISHVPVKEGHGAPPAAFVWAFVVIGIVMMVVMLALAGAKLRVAKALRERTKRTFCLVVAVLTMFGMPYGTFLGILTLLVLARPSVRRMFEAGVVQPGGER